MQASQTYKMSAYSKTGYTASSTYGSLGYGASKSSVSSSMYGAGASSFGGYASGYGQNTNSGATGSKYAYSSSSIGSTGASSMRFKELEETEDKINNEEESLTSGQVRDGASFAEVQSEDMSEADN